MVIHAYQPPPVVAHRTADCRRVDRLLPVQILIDDGVVSLDHVSLLDHAFGPKAVGYRGDSSAAGSLGVGGLIPLDQRLVVSGRVVDEGEVFVSILSCCGHSLSVAQRGDAKR